MRPKAAYELADTDDDQDDADDTDDAVAISMPWPQIGEDAAAPQTAKQKQEQAGARERRTRANSGSARRPPTARKTRRSRSDPASAFRRGGQSVEREKKSGRSDWIWGPLRPPVGKRRSAWGTKRQTLDAIRNAADRARTKGSDSTYSAPWAANSLGTRTCSAARRSASASHPSSVSGRKGDAN